MISHKLPVRDPEPAEIGASLISLAPALLEELLLQQEDICIFVAPCWE